MEARVGGVCSHGGVVEEGPTPTTKFLQHNNNNKKHIHTQTKTQIGTVPHLLAGGIAGAFGKTCTAPFARLTILFQVQGMYSDVMVLNKPCIWREGARIVNEEGFRAFWKGNLVTIAHRLPYTAVNFYTYEHYKTYFKSLTGFESRPESVGADMCLHFFCGGLAGVTAASATYPLDLIRTRLAAQRSTIYYQGIGHALRTICRDEGFFGLYKGIGATLLGVGPSIAISFSVYEAIRTHWHSKRPNDSTTMVSLASGSLSGLASSTATFPLDLVRRRMQLEGIAGEARVYNTGLVGTFKHIFRSEGLRGLYRGILPEYYKVVPGVGIVYMTYEMLKELLSDCSS